jgi:hypothetical protein
VEQAGGERGESLERFSIAGESYIVIPPRSGIFAGMTSSQRAGATEIGSSFAAGDDARLLIVLSRSA